MRVHDHVDERIPKRQRSDEPSAYATAEVIPEEWHDGCVMPHMQQSKLPRLLAQHHEERVTEVKKLAAIVDEHPVLDSSL